MLSLIFGCVVLIFVFAYFSYSKFLAKKYILNDKDSTPAHTLSDGVDYVPARAPVLLGHHFSSIAGAGPIVGPIIAGLAFGWLPALIWIVLGSIFIGGVHDFSALVASIRHQAHSIAEIAKEHMSRRAYLLFLGFIWFALVYVLAVFTDLTANTFKMDGGVATSSIIFIFLALGFGYSLYRLKLPLSVLTVFFVGLLFFSIWFGQQLPLSKIPALFGDTAKTWVIFLVIYCFFASVTPVWILLQPRDYLSSFLLYSSVLAGFAGILFGRFPLNYPHFLSWNVANLGGLFPFLFVTVACGAISGFHALVASGTSSKQLNKESDAKIVGYGAMLIEGLVAVIALATVMILNKGDELTGKPPLVVYGTGVGKFVSIFGIDPKFGFSFGLLALSTFILTTLDTATRIARYVFQELFNFKSPKTRYFATLVTLVLPTILVLVNLKDAQGNLLPAWKIIWPVFGATNQLLAALTLLVIIVWLKKGKMGAGNKQEGGGGRVTFLLFPMIFMLAMTIWALTLLILQYKLSFVGILAIILFFLALMLVGEAGKVIINPK